MLTHRNILSNLMAVNAVVQIRGDDEPMSFLPLSHVFERLALYLFLLLGCRVSFAESLQTVSRDLARVRPTIMTGVPRVFEKFHHAVLDARGQRPGCPEGPVPLGDEGRVGGVGCAAEREASAAAGRRCSCRWPMRSCSARSGRASAAVCG